MVGEVYAGESSGAEIVCAVGAFVLLLVPAGIAPYVLRLVVLLLLLAVEHLVEEAELSGGGDGEEAED